MGRCGQSGQRANPAKTHFSLLPWSCFSTRILWLRQRSGSLLAVSCRAQGKPRLLQNDAGSRQLSHWSTCILLGCLPGSCLHHAWDFTTLSSAITEGLEMHRYCQIKSVSRSIPPFRKARSYVLYTCYSQHSWCSWSFLGVTSHEHGLEAKTVSLAPAPPHFITV